MSKHNKDHLLHIKSISLLNADFSQEFIVIIGFRISRDEEEDFKDKELL